MPDANSGPPGVLVAQIGDHGNSVGIEICEEAPTPDANSGPPGVLVAQIGDHGNSVGPPPGTFVVTLSADEMSHPSTSGPPGVLLAKPKAVQGYPHASEE